MKRWLIPTIYCAYGNTVNFSCTSQIHLWVKNTPFKPMSEKPPKLLLPLGDPGPHLIHECPSRTHSPSQMTARSVCALLTTTQRSPHWLQGTTQIHLKTAHSPSTIISNTPIPWPTPLNIPNGIQIQSAILPQYTFQTHTHTHRPKDGKATGVF